MRLALFLGVVSGHREVGTLAQAHPAGKQGELLFETRAPTRSRSRGVWLVSVF